MEHLFWSCQYTQDFWYDIDAFARFFYTNEKYYIWVFWLRPHKRKYLFYYKCSFLSKFYIHTCKFSNCKPVFEVFLRDMDNYINLISVSNNKEAMKTSRVGNIMWNNGPLLHLLLLLILFIYFKLLYFFYLFVSVFFTVLFCCCLFKCYVDILYFVCSWSQQ